MDLEIFQFIFFFELLRVMNAGCTAIDRGNLGIGPTHRMLVGLGCSTSRDEDGLVFPVRFARPVQMVIGPPSFVVLPARLVFLKILDGRRIGILVVEVSNLLRHRS